ncbi:MAG: hypothetical protein ACJ741_00485 [Pyrinomonadaceae bacterium]
MKSTSATLLALVLSMQIIATLIVAHARAVQSDPRAQVAAAQTPANIESLDTPALIREVAASERINSKDYVDYTYTAETSEYEMKGGKLVRERITVAEIYPQYGESVRKIISRDGVTLSPEDSEKEFKRAVEVFKKNEQEMAKRRAEMAKQSTAPPPAPYPKTIPTFGPVWVFRPRSGLGSGLFMLSLSNFLHAGEFSNPRREQFHDRAAIVLDFRPRADFKPAFVTQKPYTKLAGRIWIDAADKQIMRVEARPIPEALKKKGDAASLAPEPWVVIEQMRLPGGGWKVCLIYLNTLADKDVFNGIWCDITETMTDFRRFNVKTDDATVDATKPPPEEP